MVLRRRRHAGEVGGVSAGVTRLRRARARWARRWRPGCSAARRDAGRVRPGPGPGGGARRRSGALRGRVPGARRPGAPGRCSSWSWTRRSAAQALLGPDGAAAALGPGRGRRRHEHGRPGRRAPAGGRAVRAGVAARRRAGERRRRPGRLGRPARHGQRRARRAGAGPARPGPDGLHRRRLRRARRATASRSSWSTSCSAACTSPPPGRRWPTRRRSGSTRPRSTRRSGTAPPGSFMLDDRGARMVAPRVRRRPQRARHLRQGPRAGHRRRRGAALPGDAGLGRQRPVPHGLRARATAATTTPGILRVFEQWTGGPRP